jgi:hypothetical protein
MRTHANTIDRCGAPLTAGGLRAILHERGLREGFRVHAELGTLPAFCAIAVHGIGIKPDPKLPPGVLVVREVATGNEMLRIENIGPETYEPQRKEKPMPARGSVSPKTLAIVTDLRNGMFPKVAAIKYGITSARVYQIAMDRGITFKHSPQIRRQQNAAVKEALDAIEKAKQPTIAELRPPQPEPAYVEIDPKELKALRRLTAPAGRIDGRLRDAKLKIPTTPILGIDEKLDHLRDIAERSRIHRPSWIAIKIATAIKSIINWANRVTLDSKEGQASC